MNRYEVDYSIEDLFEYFRNKILINWIKDNHPEIFNKAEEFVKAELLNKD
jgi:Mg/Co/Ni transporter MgtE